MSAAALFVEGHRLFKRYGSGPGAVAAVSDASLAISGGEFVAIMGPSGSGKSSLLNLLGLLDRPSSGSLRLLGEEVGAASADRRSRLRNLHIGFVFQNYSLMPRRTALSNVELPLLYRGLSSRERRYKAAAALERVGVADRATSYPACMSGGEQQRTAIARALVGDPAVVIADEPTGALDSRSGEMVLDILSAVCADGRAVILVTHDPAVAARGSRLIQISDGRIHYDAQTGLDDAQAGLIPASQGLR